MKTTKKDFELFKKYCDEVVQVLGLTEWSVLYAHEHFANEFANTNYQVSSATAVITLSTYWDGLRPKTDLALRRLALHEVLHIVLAPLVAEAMERYTNQLTIDTAEHLIIRRLENMIIKEKSQ